MRCGVVLRCCSLSFAQQSLATSQVVRPCWWRFVYRRCRLRTQALRAAIVLVCWYVTRGSGIALGWSSLLLLNQAGQVSRLGCVGLQVAANFGHGPAILRDVASRLWAHMRVLARRDERYSIVTGEGCSWESGPCRPSSNAPHPNRGQCTLLAKPCCAARHPDSRYLARSEPASGVRWRLIELWRTVMTHCSGPESFRELGWAHCGPAYNWCALPLSEVALAPASFIRPAWNSTGTTAFHALCTITV